MKLLFDFFPIILFFIAFKFFGIYTATAVAMGATVAQVIFTRIKYKRLEPMHLVTLVIIGVFGGATLWLADEIFIKWKPTAVNWVLGIVFLVSQFVGEKTLIERAMNSAVQLPKFVWIRLNLSWVLFFIVSGLINLYVVYNYDTETWVNFKLFGLLGMTALFAIVQAMYISRYIKPEDTPSSRGGH
ncbi:MAG: septation protein A [Gammaproteobacteria bacterium]|nr:septation protein A [Gammaproteobacteria bacterium]